MSGGKRQPRKKSGKPGSDAKDRVREGREKRDSRQLARAGTARSPGGGLALLLWSGVAVVIALVVIGGAIVLTQHATPTPGAPVPPTVLTPSDIASSDRTLGNPNAPVTIDLYGDFRCSACLYFTVNSGIEGQVIDKYVRSGEAKLVWHDFLSIDLNQGNTASRDAANAAWCAADQGKFWTMHDWLYANDGGGTEVPSVFTQDRLLAIGQAAGLDMSKFTPCVTGGTHFQAIAEEMSNAPKDLTGTPTVYVDGKQIDPGQVPTFQDISTAVDSALAQATSAPSASTSPAATSASPATSPVTTASPS
jgi:protein-disulfide isomerase